MSRSGAASPQQEPRGETTSCVSEKATELDGGRSLKAPQTMKRFYSRSNGEPPTGLRDSTASVFCHGEHSCQATINVEARDRLWDGVAATGKRSEQMAPHWAGGRQKPYKLATGKGHLHTPHGGVAAARGQQVPGGTACQEEPV